MRIKCNHSQHLRRLLVSLSDGDFIHNETICCSPDESDTDKVILSDRFVVSDINVQSYDACMIDVQYSLMLLTTPTSVLYCWYLNGSGNSLVGSGFNSIANALDGCAPLVWSCVQWIPRGARFIVLHSGGCFYTNPIKAPHDVLQMGSKKMAVTSEVGPLNRLLHHDESMVVELHPLHSDSFEAIMVMKSRYKVLSSSFPITSYAP